MTDFAALRRNMVDCQLRTYDVTDRAVLAAMDEVAREAFVPEHRRDIAYIDQPVQLDWYGAPGRALLPPMVCGRMLQTLDVQPGQSFLDYGCGTGYTAAVAAKLRARVTAFDLSPALRQAARGALVEVGAGDVLVVDALPTSPFDLIFVNGAADAEPTDLTGLLAPGGRLVVVIGQGRSARMTLYQRSGAVVSGRAIFDAAAPALPEFQRTPSFSL